MSEHEHEHEHEHESEESAPSTCCPLRRKIVVGIFRVFSEEECGISDSELADVMRFDLATPSGKPVLAFRFCPWCGKPREDGGETRVVDVVEPPLDEPEDEPDEYE